MAKDLTKNVWVDGVLYGPDGEKPDSDVLEKITNPKAFEDVEEPAIEEPTPEEQADADASKPAPAKKATAKKSS